jgi:glutamate decarboxylase
MLYDGRGGIPGACWKFRDGLQPNFSLYDLADRLRTRGWQVPAYSLPPNEQHTVVQRVLVRQGVSRDLAQLLLDDITSALEFFKRHPVGQPMDEAEGGGFHH